MITTASVISHIKKRVSIKLVAIVKKSLKLQNFTVEKKKLIMIVVLSSNILME